MRSSQTAALRALCDSLRAVEFQVGGSVLLLALGLDVAPRDIDIVLPAEAEEALRAAAGTWWQGRSAKSPGVVDSVWMADLVIDNEAVEAMGGLGLWVGDRLRRVPFRAGPSWDLEGTEVPLAPPGQWLALYRLYQPARAEMLAPLVDAAEEAFALDELEVTRGDLHYGNST
jgi:hypothetical protein